MGLEHFATLFTFFLNWGGVIPDIFQASFVIIHIYPNKDFVNLA